MGRSVVSSVTAEVVALVGRFKMLHKEAAAMAGAAAVQEKALGRFLGQQ
jgi:hypothetical protein